MYFLHLISKCVCVLTFRALHLMQ